MALQQNRQVSDDSKAVSKRDSKEGSWSYDAFVSYSHAADGRLAPALQQTLHRFAKPWYQRRAMRVFRDQTNLSVNPHLWGSIEEALSKSHFFLLLASPDAANSKWVTREVEYWLRERSTDTLLIVLTDGDLEWDDIGNRFDPMRSTALPSALLNAFREEPLFIDLRWAREVDDLSLRNAKFRQLVGRIAATLRGIEPDELFGEDVRQMRRTKRIALAGIGLLVILTVLSVVLAAMERQAARKALSSLAANYLQEGRQELLANKPLRSLAYIQSAYKTAPFLPDAQYMLSRAMRALTGQRVLTVNRAGLRNATFAAQGKYALLVGEDDAIEVWDASKEVRLFHSVMNLGEKSFITISDDGRWLVTAGDSSPLRLWRIEDGELLYEIDGQNENIKKAGVDGAASKMVTVSDDYIARLWDLPNKRLVSETDFNVWDAALSHDGKYMVTGSGNGFIGLWRAEDGKQLALIEAAGDTKTDRTLWSNVAFELERRRAVVTGDDGHIVILDLADDPQESRVIPLKSDKSIQLSNSVFSADGRYVAAVSWNGSSHVWDSETGEQVTVVQSHPLSDLSTGWASISPDNRFFMTMAAASREAKVWTVADGDLVKTVDGPPGWLLAAALAPDGSGVITADRDGGLRVWKIGSASEQILLPLLDWEIIDSIAATFSGNGKSIAIGSKSPGKIAVVDAETGELTKSLSMGDMAMGLVTIALNDNGTRLLAASVNTVPRLWDLKSDSEPRDLEKEVSSVRYVFDVQLSADGQVAATATRGEGLTVWRTRDNEPLALFPDVNAHLIALSSDNDYMATSERGALAIRSLKAAVPPVMLQITSDDRTVLAFNKDASRLAAGGSRGTSWVWDTATGDIVLTLEGHTGRVRDLIWTRDGARIVTAGNDGTVRVWSATRGDLLDMIWCGDRNIISVIESLASDSFLTFSKQGWLQRWAQSSAIPTPADIDKLSGCHLPWAVVDGVLIPQATRPAVCL